MFFVHRAIFKNKKLHLSVVPKPNPNIDELYCDSGGCVEVSDVYDRYDCLLQFVHRHSGL